MGVFSVCVCVCMRACVQAGGWVWVCDPRKLRNLEIA